MKLAIPTAVEVPNLMRSEVLVGATVCATDGEAHESDAISAFQSSKIDECSSLSGVSSAAEPCFWTQKVGMEQYKSNGRVTGLTTEDVSQRLNHGITSNGTALASGSEGKEIQWKVGKSPRNGTGCFKKPRMLQRDNLLHHPEADDTKMESDLVGSHLVKCSNAGMYGLKPEVHDISKFVEDISLDQLLDGSYKSPTDGKDQGRKPANVNENILDSVLKAFSILQLRGLRKEKQTEEMDIHFNEKISLISSPSNTNVDQGSCKKTEAPANMNSNPLYQPRDMFGRLALPSPKDLDLLLQDAMKSATSVKPLSHRVSLPAFPCSHNFNGHCKSNCDATKTSHKSSCQGRWLRVRSNASFTEEGDTAGYLDLDSLTYDETLIPAGQLKYELPEIEKKPSTLVNHPGYNQDSSSAMGAMSSLPPHALHSPKVLAAAQTLCDMAKHCMKAHSNGIMKWPKQPSQKVMKARKSILGEKPEEGLLTPKSEPTLDHSLRSVEFGTSLKKPRLSVVERSENFCHTPTVIGLCSVSAPRSSRSSPNRLSRDPVAEIRHCNGSLMKPPSMVPAPHRVLDRSTRNPQKLRKVGTMEWNGARG
ncbi:hypothetical protein Cgig2_030199 [Carnegiea gigantea]|uniref:Uncharacterized protein n=1 Tax=Carnegiea gigantea TaxID=171969 RepID=A0A9Q1K9B3_9CARY|nr:hypothetical protein Cgig2_031545 [Carnegiea gigantea]KAJ8439264.1 hypothetical protein Cgig2_030199 [Carnegiea gigantea]